MITLFSEGIFFFFYVIIIYILTFFLNVVPKHCSVVVFNQEAITRIIREF